MKKKHVKRNGRSGRLQSVTLCISTALVLILLGLVVFSTLLGRNLSAHVKENLVVTVMLQQDMGDNEAQTLTRSIARCPYIKDIRFISKRDALKDAAKEMGANPASFTDGVNPFSSSIELTLKSDYANSDSLQWIAKDLKKYPKVSTISYQRDLIDAVNRNLAKIGVVLLVLAVAADYRLFLTDQQHCASGHLRTSFLHPYHETRWSFMGLHSPAVHSPVRSHRSHRCPSGMCCTRLWHVCALLLRAGDRNHHVVERDGDYRPRRTQLRYYPYGYMHHHLGEPLLAHEGRRVV